MKTRNDVTELLQAWSRGDRAALAELMPMVARELRELAGAYLRGERVGHTLQPTALVNEAYLRLVDRRQVEWRDRTHFFAFAARVMRRILVDHARARRTEKRGSAAPHVTLSDAAEMAGSEAIDIIDLDRALDALARLDVRQARIVELRYFGGLTIDETAAVLDVGTATVSRDWATAKAFLYLQLAG